MITPSLKVLVVDDSAVTRKIVRAQLAVLGVLLDREAIHGQNAIDIMRSWMPHLIVSDYDMTPVNGSELLSHVRGVRLLAGVPFVMMTGLKMRFRDTGRDGGLTHYLTKPFKTSDLEEKINAALAAAQRLADGQANHAGKAILGLIDGTHRSPGLRRAG